MDQVMVATHTASLHGPAAHTWLQSREASQRLGNPQTYFTPKQTRRNTRLRAAVAVTASQDTLSLLPCVNEHNCMASPCPLVPQHAADAATVNAFSHLPPASEQQPDVLEVLTQQLAEQHIPFCLPSQPLTPAPFSDSSTGHLTHSAAGHYLLDRYLQDVPACTTPQSLPTQEAKQQASCQSVQHDPVMPDTHSVVSQPMTSRHQQHLQSSHFEHAGLAPCVPACTAMAAAHSQHQISSTALVTHLTPSELCQSPHFACMQELASRALLDNHRCADRTCQSAEVLRLQSSKGQTWKGLALRQAFMGRALRHSDDEVSVQDAAGGGGLLNGGAEDGGEGGGPSRGWGGAAGEDGHAEEDDEDEDQDDDEDQNDSSSEDSQSEFDWTSSSLSEPSSMQHVGGLPHDQRVATSADNNSNVCSCSQSLHRFPQSKQQVRKPYVPDQQDNVFYQLSRASFLGFDSCANTYHAAATKADVKASCQQHILTSSTRYRTTCRHKSFLLMSSDRKQQDHVVRYKNSPIHKQKRSGGHVWKEIPDFAIRLGINVLGSCL